MTPSTGACTGAPQIRCTLGDMPAGASAQVVIVAQVAKQALGTTLTNTATVSSDTPEIDPSNNTDSAEAPVLAPGTEGSPELELTKRALTDSPAVGRPIQYQVDVVNRGNVSALDARVLDTMDDSVVVVSATVAGGSCTTDGSTVSCKLGRLDPGDTATILATVYPTGKGTLRNTASVSVVGQGSVEGRPIDHADVVVAQGRNATLSIRKSADRRRVRSGGTVGYRIVVRNTSRTTALRVRVCDPLPRGLTYVRVYGATVRRGIACWSVDRLGAGRSRSFRLTTRALRTDAARTLRNTATVSAANARRRTATAGVRVSPRGAVLGGVTG